MRTLNRPERTEHARLNLAARQIALAPVPCGCGARAVAERYYRTLGVWRPVCRTHLTAE